MNHASETTKCNSVTDMASVLPAALIIGGVVGAVLTSLGTAAGIAVNVAAIAASVAWLLLSAQRIAVDWTRPETFDDELGRD